MIKGDKPVVHGHKAHIAVDDGSEIVRAVETTPGSVHDSGRRTARSDRSRVGRVCRCGPLRHRQAAPPAASGGAAAHPLQSARRRADAVADGAQLPLSERLKKNALHFTLLAIAHKLRRWPPAAGGVNAYRKNPSGKRPGGRAERWRNALRKVPEQRARSSIDISFLQPNRMRQGTRCYAEVSK